MPRLLQISQLGHPILRKKTEAIKSFSNKALQSLIDDMVATVKEVGGVGIAANQVYESKRVFIVASSPNKRYPKAPKMKPLAMINPIIIDRSAKLVKDWEGCLSIPGIRGLVPRHTSIKVEYRDRKGKKQVKVLKNFIARIFQHEFDHINGLVYLDQLETNKDIITENEYYRLLK